MQLAFHADSLDQTETLAWAIAPLLRAGDVLALSGDLGAGKTTLVRALATCRGIDPALVSSPTFVIVNEYPPARDGEPPMIHVDAYRLTSGDDLDPLGWDRLADGSAVLLIEWPERIAEALEPDRTATLSIRATGEASRELVCEFPASWAERAGFDGLEALVGGAETEPSREATTCPVTGRPVAPDAPTWPFASEQARLADLYKWFNGQHQISRPIEQRDIEQGE